MHSFVDEVHLGDDFFDGLDRAVETLRLGSSAERAAALLQLSSDLVASLDVRQALLSVGEAVRQLCEAERFITLDAELLITSARGQDGAELATPLPYCHELARLCATDEKVHAVYLPLDTSKWGQLQSVRSLRLVGMLAVPLVGARGLRGVIYCDSKNGFAAQLDDATVEVLALLGQHAAQAIEYAQLLERVTKDPQSELHNSAYFERRLQEELTRSTRYRRPFSLVAVELSNASEWLPRYGTAGLDQMMRQVGEVLRAECRQSDVLARVGPARFGLLLPELDADTPRDFTARTRVRLQGGTFRIGDSPQKVLLIVGAVTYQTTPVLGLKGLTHELDLAVEVARREGEDRYLVR
jgi:diguanylate cyclase (GGDEF)-like protein